MRSGDHYVIVGLGKTGVSCAKFLLSQGMRVSILEENPENTQCVTFQNMPGVSVYHQDLTESQLQGVTAVIVSPGVPLTKPFFTRCRQLKITLMGDIDLFAQAFKGNIVAITGTNGKSTVTALVGDILRAAGEDTIVAGNIGAPVADFLPSSARYAVLELSSYQLELTKIISPVIATILNITPDHLDRYPTYQDYVNAKQRIFDRCPLAVVNAQDPKTSPISQNIRQIRFTNQAPGVDEYGVLQRDGQRYLAKGQITLLPVSALKINGLHNWENALAAFAMADALGIDWQAIRDGLSHFPGLPHRSQWVRTLNDVQYINDSKGTNVGATIAALQGVGADLAGQVVLIAGGRGKDADFTLLRSVVSRYCRAVIVFGEDQQKIAKALQEQTQIILVRDLVEAVSRAQQVAQPKDIVLLSPACASWDMFDNFMQRGDVYMQLVKDLAT